LHSHEAENDEVLRPAGLSGANLVGMPSSGVETDEVRLAETVPDR
jgi:hypothetical protein